MELALLRAELARVKMERDGPLQRRQDREQQPVGAGAHFHVRGA